MDSIKDRNPKNWNLWRVCMVKPKLIHKQRIPYNAPFVMDDKAAGLVGTGVNFEALYASVIRFRRSNSIPIGLGLENELEAAICAKYPDECKETDITVPPKPRTVSYRELLTGTKVMVSLLSAGRPLVSAEEANRRANICVTCRHNVQFTRPCGGLCPELQKIVATIVGNQKVAAQDDLKSCHICGCYLQSAVWLPLEIQVPPLPEHVKKQFESIGHCWKKASLIESH